MHFLGFWNGIKLYVSLSWYEVWHLKISAFGDLLEYAKEIKIKHHEEKTIQRPQAYNCEREMHFSPT